MHEPDLVGVHEARIAHHVAAVRQVHRQHRPAAVLDRAAPMVVQLFVVVRADVAPGEGLLEVLEEGGIDGHHILEVPMDRAVLDHEDAAVALDDLRLDLADLLVQQDPVVALAVENLLPGLANADRAQRIGVPRPAKRRLHLLPGLLQRQVRPVRREGIAGLHAVQGVERQPGTLCGEGQPLLHTHGTTSDQPSTQRIR